MPQLNEWANFYVVVGAAAGSLIGLQFVVLTLISQRPERPAAEAGDAFSTPTVLHFCTVVLIAAIAEMPWRELSTVYWMFALIGLLGVGYAIITFRRMRSQDVYEPEIADWVSYVVMPFAGYLLLLGAAMISGRNARIALFSIGASALILLFIGIYNAWDVVI
jgi:hypothetical protein